MVTAAGGNAARQAVRVAIEYQSGLRGRPVKLQRLLRKSRSGSGMVLDSLYCANVNYWQCQHCHTVRVMSDLCVYVCVKREREREREVMFCEECESGSVVLLWYIDGEVERSHASPLSTLGVRTWQSPDQGSPITKQVTNNISGMIVFHI